MAIQDQFEFLTAYNPDTEELQANAEFQVFAVTDADKTSPLPVYAPESGVAITPLRSNSIGMLPSFRVEGDPTEVIVQSSTFSTRLASKYGALREAGFDPDTIDAAIQSGISAADAKAAAEDARDEARSAAAVLAQLAENQGAPLIEDSDEPGLYLILNPAALSEDPDEPGLYVIGGA